MVDTSALARWFPGSTMTAEAKHPLGPAEVVSSLTSVGVVPVVTIDDESDGSSVVAALVRGGLTVVEITLRTTAGIRAIARAGEEVPSALIGAGSVCSAREARDAIEAGARFIVSPGLDEEVIVTARERGVIAIPGVATATELMRASNLGLELVKLFPAEVVGGVDLVRALSAVWPTVRFLPTGGISAVNAGSYLAHPQVVAVGGSWMVPLSLLRTRDWAGITAAAAEARLLAAGVS